MTSRTPTAAAPAPTSPDEQVATRRLLAHLGAAVIAAGFTVPDAEAEMRRLAAHLGHRDAQVAANPTTVILSLASGEASTVERIDGPLRFDQSLTVRRVRRALLAGRMDGPQVLEELSRVRQQPHLYGRLGFYLGQAVAAGGICMIMQPGAVNVALTVLVSLLVSFLARQAGRHALLAALLPSLAALVSTVVMLAGADAGWLQGPLRTLICPIAVLLPGGLLSTGVAELASGSMVSGTARVFHGVVQLLLFTLGVVSGCMVMGVPTSHLTNTRVDQLGLWAAPVGLALIAVGITLGESMPRRLAPWSAAVLALTFCTQLLGQAHASQPVGAFAGAMVASFASTALDALRNIPRLVTLLPSFWLLVPGTLGLMGITTLGVGTGQVEAVLAVVTVVTSIALGLLFGSALAIPLGRIARRVEWLRLGARQRHAQDYL